MDVTSHVHAPFALTPGKGWATELSGHDGKENSAASRNLFPVLDLFSCYTDWHTQAPRLNEIWSVNSCSVDRCVLVSTSVINKEDINYTRENDFYTWKVYCVSNVTFHAELKYGIKIIPSPTVFVQWLFYYWFFGILGIFVSDIIIREPTF